MNAATIALLWWIGGSWTVALGFAAACAIRDRIAARRAREAETHLGLWDQELSE